MAWAVARGGASIIGSKMQSDAASTAAQTQANAANRATELQQQNYQSNWSAQAPYRSAGYNALAQLQWLMGMQPSAYSLGQTVGTSATGLTPSAIGNLERAEASGIDPSLIGDLQAIYAKWDAEDAAKAGQQQASISPSEAGFVPTGQFGSLNQTFNADSLKNDPGYQYRMDEANKALQRSAAAKGGLLSGGTLRGLSSLNQNLASQEYQNAYNRFSNDQTTRYNRLANLAGLGQTATNMTGQLGQASTNAISDYMTQAANANAAGTLGKASAWNSGIQSAINGINNYNTWNQLMGNNSSNSNQNSYDLGSGSIYDPNSNSVNVTGSSWYGD